MTRFVSFPWPRRIPGHAVAAVALVAATYIYFLLFAQFGFLQGIRDVGLGARSIPIVLGGMAVAGVLASFTAPRMIAIFGRGGTMGLGLFVGAGAAASAGYTFASGLKDIGHLLIAAIGIGAGLGLTTVGLATDLRRLTRARNPGLCAGCGTGIAYLVCNIPALYGAAPTTKAWFVAVLAAVAVVAIAVSRGPAGPEFTAAANRIPSGWRGTTGIAAAVVAFLALVWFDSAAFAALQLNPDMLQRHWGTGTARWLNGGVHAIAAVVGGLLLDRGLLRNVLAIAMLLLLAGAWSFAATGPTAALAAPAYVIGVSFYSTALAVFAALAPDGSGRDTAAWRAAWIYAVAGWIGSAAGVGLAEQRGQLPSWAGSAAAIALALALVPTVLPFGRKEPQS